MALLELKSPFPVETTVGKGYAILVESDAHDQWWTVILDSGAIVVCRNDAVRAKASWSHGRIMTDTTMQELVAPCKKKTESGSSE